MTALLEYFKILSHYIFLLLQLFSISTQHSKVQCYLCSHVGGVEEIILVGILLEIGSAYILHSDSMFVCTSVSEEDEVSIKEVARMVADAMDFKGELLVCITHEDVV